MKRQIDEIDPINPDSANSIQPIDWSRCCICGQDGDLRSTVDGIVGLAKQFASYWKNEVLPFDASSITTNYVVVVDEQPDFKPGEIHPDFETVMKHEDAKYHHNCKTNFSKHKMDKKLIAIERKKAKKLKEASACPSRSSSRSSGSSTDLCQPKCVICNEFDDIDNLHAAGAFHASKEKLKAEHVNKQTQQWREMALVVEDDGLASRLQIQDLGASSSFYHKLCSTNLYNRFVKKNKEKTESVDAKEVKAAAWDKVVTFMEETAQVDSKEGFEIHQLEDIYLDHLSCYGIDIESHITRFGKELLERAPDYEIIKDKETRVFRKESVREHFSIFRQSSQNWIESIRTVIRPIREDMFQRKNSFNGELNKTQDQSISPYLLALMSMLIDGVANVEGKCSQAVLTLSGLVTFNARKVRTPSNLNHRHHKKERETPVSIYLGLKLYSTIGSRVTIDYMFHLGLCISYPRVLSITKSVYEALCKNYARHGIFLPSNLKKGCFVILVKDNIDKNASSNLVHSHYHGTSISLLQFPDSEATVESIDTLDYIDVAHKLKKLAPLPSEYKDPEKVHRSSDEYFAPLCSYNFTDLEDLPDLKNAKSEERKWAAEFSTGENNKAWAQHHVAKNDTTRDVPSEVTQGENALLPLLSDKVNTLDMQCHTMKLNKKAVNALNPGQTPVDTSDCPIYALTKEAIYRFPHKFSDYVAMFGGLHIEQCLLVVHGQLIENSGLKEILDTCSLATIGTGAVVDVNHIKRARYCLQVSLCSLYRKLVNAAKNDGSHLDPFDWLTEKAKTSDMSFYLKMVIELEMEFLAFVRSIREGNFPLYIQSLRSLSKWFFILDHYNYARWITVHLFDLISLHITFPGVYQEMMKGSFSFCKTKRPFSRMALDQVHEQNNKIIKGQGGATRSLNLEDESALIRWETCGPEIARITSEFEDEMKDDSESQASQLKHHEDNKHFQEQFSKDVNTVFHAIVCNPFEIDSLCALNDTSRVFPDSIGEKLREMLPTGEAQVVAFINDRLLFQKSPITETITKNNFPILNVEKQKKAQSIDLSVTFMNKLRSSVVHRPLQAEKLFDEELYGVPACFSVDHSDVMYHGTKASMADRFLSCQPPNSDPQNTKAVIIEASPLFRKLSGQSFDSFHDYAVVFYHHVVNSAKDCHRLDVVFDRYFDHSLKTQTREGRGKGGTRIPKIADDVAFPHNFLNFLCNSGNKNDLGDYLAVKLIEIHAQVGTARLNLCVTYEERTLSTSQLIHNAFLLNSTAEEADQKIVRHALHCIKSMYDQIVVYSIDTDVLVLLLGYVASEMENATHSFSMYFKMVSSSPKWYNICQLVEELGADVCKALPFFYCFTGCDTVSAFNGKGKCSFFDEWMKSRMKDSITNVFIKLGHLPDSVSAVDTSIIVSLVKSVYFGSQYENVNLNELRKYQFTRSVSNDLKKIAPSTDALYMQILRASHVAGFEWVECVQNVAIPDPSLRGYVLKDGVFVPQWLPVPSTFDLKAFLKACKCKTAKCITCKCAKLKLPCLPLCHCNQKCKQK